MPPTIITQTQRYDDIVDWLLHKGFNVRRVNTVTNGTTAIVVGDNLLGHLLYSINGTTWKRLVAADNLAAVGARLGIMLPDKNATVAIAAAAAMPNQQALTHGPARCFRSGIVIPAGVTAATVHALLEAQGIQLLDQTGSLYEPTGLRF